MYCLSTLKAKLSSLLIIRSSELVKLSLDKYLITDNLLVPGQVSTFAISKPMYDIQCTYTAELSLGF